MARPSDGIVKKDGNRREYRRKEIIERYFRGEEAFEGTYFGNGTSS